MTQTFTCDLCKKTGAVRIRKHEDVWGVAVKIVDKHRRISPECDAGLNEIRAHSQLGIIATKKARRAA